MTDDERRLTLSPTATTMPTEALMLKGSAAERLNALRITDEKRWRSEIRAALLAAEGRVARAAKALGVGLRTLFRWVADDESLRARVVVTREDRQRQTKA